MSELTEFIAKEMVGLDCRDEYPILEEPTMGQLFTLQALVAAQLFTLRNEGLAEAAKIAQETETV